MPKLHCSGDGFHGNLTLSADQVKAAKKPKGAKAKMASEKMASEMDIGSAMEANVLAVRRAPKKAGATKATALTKADAMPARVLKHKYDPVMAVAAKSEQKSSHSDAPTPAPKPKKAKAKKAKKVKEIKEIKDVEAPPAAQPSSSKSAPKAPAKIPSPARAKTPARVNVGKNAIDDPDANLADAFKELDFDV